MANKEDAEDDKKQGELLLDADQPDEQQQEFDRLQKELENFKTRAESAESRAAALETETRQTTTRLSDEIATRFTAQESALATALKSTETALATTRELLTKAHEEGRSKDVAELTEQLADHKADLKALTWQKGNLEAQKADAVERAKQQPQVSSDPTERLLASVPEGRGREWLRGHRDIATKMANDPRFLARVAAVDNEAYAEGHDRNTDGYFEYVEIKLGLRADPNAKKQETQVADTRQRTQRTSTAAPPSRTISVGTRQGQNASGKITLSDKERQDARWMFPDKKPEEAEQMYLDGLTRTMNRQSEQPWERMQ